MMIVNSILKIIEEIIGMYRENFSLFTEISPGRLPKEIPNFPPNHKSSPRKTIPKPNTMIHLL